MLNPIVKSMLSSIKRVKRPVAWAYPRMLEKQYANALTKLITAWINVYKNTVVSTLLSLQNEIHQDSWSDTLIGSINRAKATSIEVGLPYIRGVAAKYAGYVDLNNAKQAKSVFKSSLGIDLYTSDKSLSSKLSAFVNENVSLITNLSDDLANKVSQSIFNDLRSGKRVASIAKDITSTGIDGGPFSKVKTRAKLIARDQIGKLNASLTKMRQSDLGIDSYIWRTSLDERVRPEHAAREGKRFSWDNPPEDGHPGEPIQCRCYAEPDLKSALNKIGIDIPE